MRSPVAAGLALGLAADALVGDPRRGHPVAGFGRVAGAAERLLYADSQAAGAAYTGLLVTGAALVGVVGRKQTGVVAAATWAVVGGTTLRREARTMSRLLQDDDLPMARQRLSHLCGREANDLDAAGLARGTVESVAENTSDAVVAPLLWGAVAGVPGLLTYRAINTLDAMIGHRSARYLRFGWAAARADDLANLVPSRVSAALAGLLAPVVRGRPAVALRVWRRDGGKHLSPNAGQVEAAFAGALGRTFGGPVTYAGRTVDLPLLGDGPAPGPADIARATRLSAAVTVGAGALAIGLRLLLDRR
ncbi:MAG: cobalamin biosynthesis protein [Mycobacteriales bacterium]